MFFSINEHFHFDTENENLSRISNGNDVYEIQGVETIHVSTDGDRVIILTRDNKSIDFLYGFSLSGKLIFKVEPPKHYSFWYLGGIDTIACNAVDEFAERSPLSGWMFSLNLNTGELKKGSPVY